VEPLGIVVGAVIAAVLVLVAAYFVWRQRAVLRTLHYEEDFAPEQRRYLIKQSHRRIFGSVLLLLLAAMMVGSLFLDLTPVHANEQEAKQSLRFLSFYIMSMLLVLLVILVLAVVDFWATAKHGFQQQKKLLQDHREALEAELMEHRIRRSEIDGVFRSHGPNS